MIAALTTLIQSLSKDEKPAPAGGARQTRNESDSVLLDDPGEADQGHGAHKPTHHDV